jgi:hypothetical protein
MVGSTPPAEGNAEERSETPVGVLSELADTGVGLKSLVATFPDYAHRSAQILKAPFRSFRAFQVPTRTEFRQSLAFLLQGLILSFIVVTMGRALPQSIATFSAVSVPLMAGSRADLFQYGQRVETISQTLSPELTRSWLRQGELMLAVRVLSEERFKVLLERLRQLSVEKPQVLQLAIDGSPGVERFGGRGYLLSFFMSLNPQMGPLFFQTSQLAYAGPNYQLQPHVEFLLSSLLVWFLACAFIARFMPSVPGDPRKQSVFAMGALLWGVLNPLYQSFNTLLRFYLAATLPAYVPLASQMLSTAPPTGLAEVSGGIFPYENLALGTVRIIMALSVLGMAIGVLSVGLRSVFHVSKTRAIEASAGGVFLGLGVTEGAMRIIAIILAPTGLL